MERFGNEEREGSRVRNEITGPCRDNTSNLDTRGELTPGENIRNGVPGQMPRALQPIVPAQSKAPGNLS